MGPTRAFIIICLTTVLQDAVGRDWCSLPCTKGRHTMCIYRPQTSKNGCRGIVDNQTPSGRKEMLHLHNKYRDDLASGKMSGWPKGANMRQMSWDHDCERVALRWAQQCQAGHDACRSTFNFSYVGQNYGMGGSTDTYPSSNGSFEGWVKEISLIPNPKSMVKNFQGGDWGHYTQVVWAESYKLGCGEIHTVDGGFKSTVVICNYGPGGNFLDTPMYEEGRPCAKCPAGTECRSSSFYPNLCALPDDDAEPVDIPSVSKAYYTLSNFLPIISMALNCFVSCVHSQ